MEKKKKNIVIGMASLFLVTLLLLGLTYAYYKTRVVGNSNEKSVSVTSKKYEVTYTDGDATLSTNGKIEPGFKFTKEFTVTNTGSESVNYSIILDNIENTFTRDQDWEYTLTKGVTQIATGTIAVGTHQVLIGSETLASGSTTYKLEVEYVNSEEDQSEDMGESMSFRVNISDETITWDNATSGTLLYAIKTNQPNGTGSTTLGEISLETEARILSTQDDYGTSYIYRGNVTNNYVNYSGMCWRIVRVQGDGTIKLALADENGECNADTYSTSNTKSAFINSGTKYNYNSSKKILNEWSSKEVSRNGKQETNLDTSKLVDAEWCKDMTTKADENQYYTIYYGTYNRLSKTPTNPTLKCNMKGLGGVSNAYEKAQKDINKLGLLSADEIFIVGATESYTEAHNHYLKINANANEYWTLSYMYYSSGYYYMFAVTADGAFINYTNDSKLSIRPSIVLASNVAISSTTQDGTMDNPYVIS